MPLKIAGSFFVLFLGLAACRVNPQHMPPAWLALLAMTLAVLAIWVRE